MKKFDYDLFVVDKINNTQYSKIIRCNQDSTVHHLKQKLSSSISNSFEIIFNEEILMGGMLLKETFSRHIQNYIQINPIIEPTPDQIKKPRYNSTQLKKKIFQDDGQEIYLEQSQLTKILNSQQSIVIEEDDKTSKSCQSCQMKKQILSNYEISIQNLLDENSQLKQEISELEKLNRISIYKQKLEKQQKKN